MKRVLTIFITSMFIVSISPQSVLAAEKELDYDLYCKTVECPYYDPTATDAVCTTDGKVKLVGSEDDEKVYNFFIGKGLEPFQVAGIMGNMEVESGIEPQRLQGTPSGKKTSAETVSGNTGWGIVQWTPASKFIDRIKPTRDANDLGVQLDFLWKQLQGNGPLPEKQAGDDLKATKTIEEAVLAFQGNRSVGGKYIGYERPADQAGSVQKRTDYARAFLARYGSNGSPSSNNANEQTAPDPCKGSGTVVGGFSLPVDRKWYTQHKEWFTKPHHDYPAADIPVPTGTPIYSMTDGKIIKAPVSTRTTGYGYGVMIDAGNGILFIYGHGVDGGSIAGAKEGDTVKAGQLIMHSGNTGHSTGPHLHLEIRINQSLYCPQQLFVDIAAGGNIRNLTDLARSGCTN